MTPQKKQSFFASFNLNDGIKGLFNKHKSSIKSIDLQEKRMQQTLENKNKTSSLTILQC